MGMNTQTNGTESNVQRRLKNVYKFNHWIKLVSEISEQTLNKWYQDNWAVLWKMSQVFIKPHTKINFEPITNINMKFEKKVDVGFLCKPC